MHIREENAFLKNHNMRLWALVTELELLVSKRDFNDVHPLPLREREYALVALENEPSRLKRKGVFNED